MRIKLDENIPNELKNSLASLHDVDTVKEEGLAGRDDGAIWLAAQSEQRILITQDLDFSDVRFFTPGTHSGIVLERLRNPSRREIQSKVEAICRHRDVETWHGCFVVVTDNKVRVRRPKPL